MTNRETATFPHNNQREGMPLPNPPFPLPPHAAMIPPPRAKAWEDNNTKGYSHGGNKDPGHTAQH